MIYEFYNKQSINITNQLSASTKALFLEQRDVKLVIKKAQVTKCVKLYTSNATYLFQKASKNLMKIYEK